LLVELPELEPLEPVLLPEVLGEVLGEVDELPELEPLVPPLDAPLLDLSKWASHSAREMLPSLLVSTDVKLGAEELALLLEPDAPDEGEDDEDEEGELELELEPEADGVDGEDEEELLCATAMPDRAKSAAAVAALMTLRFNIGRISFGLVNRTCVTRRCKRRSRHPA
jgi:hypothetical protein